MAINPRALEVASITPWRVNAVAVGLFFGGVAFAHWYERLECWRHSRFRDKSALYAGRNKDPENNPSWGPKGPYKYNFSNETYRPAGGW